MKMPAGRLSRTECFRFGLPLSAALGALMRNVACAALVGGLLTPATGALGENEAGPGKLVPDFEFRISSATGLRFEDLELQARR